MTRSKPALLLAFLLALGLPLVGCGSGGLSGSSGFPRSSAVFILPFLPASGGTSIEVVLTNYFGEDADVTVTAFAPNGGMTPGGDLYAAPSTLEVPANGTLHVSLASITGPGFPDGGFLWVDSRDTSTLHAVTGEPTVVSSTGFIVPGIVRDVGGLLPRGDAIQGVVPRAGDVTVGVFSRTTALQLVNTAFVPMAGGADPIPMDFDITFFDEAGDEDSSFSVTMPENGALAFATTVALGHVRVSPDLTTAPPGAKARHALTALEDGSVVHAHPRYLDLESTLSETTNSAFAVEFGTDFDGNVHDFGLLMSNPNGSARTMSIQAIYRRGGQPVTTVPQLVTLSARRTIFLTTTNVRSEGLEIEEASPFAGFGDAITTTGVSILSVIVSAPRDVEVTGRELDPNFDAFYQVLRGGRQTQDMHAFDFPVEFPARSGRRNHVMITNPTSNPLTVRARAHTPGGTEYLLPDIVVPAFQRFDWTLDGTIFKEDPNSLVETPLPCVRVRMAPFSGAYFSARTREYDANDLIVFSTPWIVDEAN